MAGIQQQAGARGRQNTTPPGRDVRAASAWRKRARRTVEAELLRTTTARLLEHRGGEDRVTAPPRMLVQATQVRALRRKRAPDRSMNGGDVGSRGRPVAASRTARARTCSP